MSENYVSNDGYKPLVLPLRGEDLSPGRQYLLTPLARLILEDRFGLHNVPTVVECLSARHPATCIRSCVENLETGQVLWTVSQLPEREATFRAFLGKGRILKFTVDLRKLEELAPFYSTSHKLPKLEEDWFTETAKYDRSIANRKFRGQPLRWWARESDPDAPAKPVRLGKSFGTAKAKGPVLDPAWFDVDAPSGQ